MTAVYLSPLTNNSLGRGATSGYWGPISKQAGVRRHHRRTARPKPVYLLHQGRQGGAARRALKSGARARATPKTSCATSSASRREGAGHRPGGRKSWSVPRCSPTTTIIRRPQRRRRARLEETQGHRRFRHARPSYRDKAKLRKPASLAQRLQQHDVKKKKTKYGHGEAWGALNNNMAQHRFDRRRISTGLRSERCRAPRPCFQCARMCPWDARSAKANTKARWSTSTPARVARHFFQSRHQGQRGPLPRRAHQ
jgi:hypothetical protein